jgi:hypothetical protein
VSAGAERLDLRGAHVRPERRGLAHGRLRPRRVLTGFIGGIAILIGVAAGIGAVATPVHRAPCAGSGACGAPPVLSEPLINETVWRSSLYGYSFEYPGRLLSVVDSSGSAAVLGAQFRNGGGATIVVRGEPASDGTPKSAIPAALGRLSGVSAIARDTTAGDQLLGGGVGHRLGAGGAYEGVLASPQGVSQSESIVVEAASDGRVLLTVSVAASSGDAGPRSELYQLADAIVNSVQWAGGR